MFIKIIGLSYNDHILNQMSIKTWIQYLTVNRIINLEIIDLFTINICQNIFVY